MQTECDIPVSILDDPIIEDLEVFFILAVSSAERVVVRPDRAMANVTIIDDECKHNITLQIISSMLQTFVHFAHSMLNVLIIVPCA